mmetsp:Transcript_1003/g.1928  ORF Transcript_1003/g.1928 Transcript_1003/m.1928 type:complete len:205 (-) Transcript_1003:1378-1992(-)
MVSFTSSTCRVHAFRSRCSCVSSDPAPGVLSRGMYAIDFTKATASLEATLTSSVRPWRNWRVCALSIASGITPLLRKYASTSPICTKASGDMSHFLMKPLPKHDMCDTCTSVLCTSRSNRSCALSIAWARVEVMTHCSLRAFVTASAFAAGSGARVGDSGLGQEALRFMFSWSCMKPKQCDTTGASAHDPSQFTPATPSSNTIN